jgi:hypothetical protein
MTDAELRRLLDDVERNLASLSSGRTKVLLGEGAFLAEQQDCTQDLVNTLKRARDELSSIVKAKAERK